MTSLKCGKLRDLKLLPVVVAALIYPTSHAARLLSGFLAYLLLRESLVPSAEETFYSSTLAVALPFDLCSFGAVFILVICTLLIYLLICSHRAAVQR